MSNPIVSFPEDLSKVSPDPVVWRFGVFEFDAAAGTLLRDGDRRELRPQQARALSLLLSRHGDVVSRDELRVYLWGPDTFLEFEAGLNTCIRRLRTALGEEAGQPRFIRTIPGEGYRFIAPAIAEPRPEPRPALEVRLKEVPGSAPFTEPGRRRTLGLVIGGLALAVAAGLVALLAARAPSTVATRPLVVVGQFEGASGDDDLDAAIERAFRIGLGETSGLEIVSPEEVESTLERMRRSAEAAIDREVGLEVSRRAGAGALVLAGLQSVGDTFQLHGEVIGASTGRTDSSQTVTAEGRDALVAALDKLVDRVTGALSTSLDAELQTPALAAVTTADLGALQAYTRALELQTGDPIRQALLEEAVALDPEFAMAHGRLAVAALDRGDARAALAHLEDAAATPGRLTDFERIYVEGHIAVLGIRGEDALRSWSVLAGAFPESALGFVNLSASHVYYRNDHPACVEVLERAPIPTPELAPLPGYQMNAVECLLGAGRVAESLARAEAVDRLELGFSEPLVFLPLVALGRLDEAARLLDVPDDSGLVEPFTPTSELKDAMLRADLADFPGAVDVMRRLLARESEPASLDGTAYRVAMTAFLEAAGERAEARAEVRDGIDVLLSQGELPEGPVGGRAVPGAALLGAQAARLDELELASRLRRWLARGLERRGPIEVWASHVALFDAELAAAVGDVQGAIDRLRPHVEASLVYPLHSRARLADWLEALADPEGARAEYRFVAEHRGRGLVECIGSTPCVDTPLNMIALGEADRRVGRASVE